MTESRKPTPPRSGRGALARVNAHVEECPGGCPRCCAPVTTEQLKAIFTSASDNALEGARGAFNDAFMKFQIDTCLRKAHFFAQIRAEVGPGIKTLAESMNYSEESLKTTFKYFRDNPEEAKLYGRNKAHAADQEAIANRAYANRLGNGDVESGDGWSYRGKGYIQLTGRGNYQDVQNEIVAKYPESGVDIIANKDDILTARGGMIAAMGYWSMRGLNAKADAGSADADVDAVTAVVNKHTHSYADRKEYFKTTKETFRVDECTKQ